MKETSCRGSVQQERGREIFTLKCEEASWLARLAFNMMHAGLMGKVGEK